MPARDDYSLYDLQLEIETDPFVWLATLFPATVTAPFGDHHIDFWERLWEIDAGPTPPDPLVSVWNRGGAKSSSLEMGVVALGARGVRSYCLYVCRTQDMADDHVGEIGVLLESPEIAAFYPALATRRVTKFGAAKAWRRNRLWTAGGLVVDAMGLDSSARGAKLDQQRPDILVFDDIDSEEDTEETVRKLVRTITKRILPTATGNAAVLAGQNLIHDDSVFAQLVDGRADFLARRHITGGRIVPAVDDLEVELIDGRWTITAGTPTWEGFDIAACQAFIDRWGISAFMSEAQHDTEPEGGGIFDHLDFEALQIDKDDVPLLERVAVWCDPAVTKTDHSDAHGVQVDGLGVDGVIYRLHSWEKRATPMEALKVAIYAALDYGSTVIGVETDQGGETWESVLHRAKAAVIFELAEKHGVPVVGGSSEDELPVVLAEWEPAEISAVRRLTFLSRKAGEGYGPKHARAARMLVDYERPGPPIRHVRGTHRVLERAMRRFGRRKPFDLVDAAYWSWQDLRSGGHAGTAREILEQLGSWRR